MQTSNPRVTRKSHWERVSGSKAHACLPTTEWGGYRDNERDTRRAAELAHFNRYSTPGELTASIAHELNQPLGAILTNAETAEILLKSSARDLDELREDCYRYSAR
jgi:C4-dicarboxylate-specific signal transduction histidine kinase